VCVCAQCVRACTFISAREGPLPCGTCAATKRRARWISGLVTAADGRSCSVAHAAPERKRTCVRAAAAKRHYGGREPMKARATYRQSVGAGSPCTGRMPRRGTGYCEPGPTCPLAGARTPQAVPGPGAQSPSACRASLAVHRFTNHHVRSMSVHGGQSRSHAPAEGRASRS
jgi:hypothetical protein